MAKRSNNGDAAAATVDVVKRRWRVILGWGLVIVGAVFLVLGWIGVSGEPEVARQLSYLASGGLGGLAASLVGVGLLISEDLRSERKRLGRIEASLLDVNDLLLAAKPAAGTRRRSKNA